MIYDWTYSFDCDVGAMYSFQASRNTPINLCALTVIDVVLHNSTQCLTMQSTVMGIGRLGEWREGWQP